MLVLIPDFLCTGHRFNAQINFRLRIIGWNHQISFLNANDSVVIFIYSWLDEQLSLSYPMTNISQEWIVIKCKKGGTMYPLYPVGMFVILMFT